MSNRNEPTHQGEYRPLDDHEYGGLPWDKPEPIMRAALNALIADRVAEGEAQKPTTPDAQEIAAILEAHQFDIGGAGIDPACVGPDAACGWTHPWDRPVHEMWAAHREHVAVVLEARMRPGENGEPAGA